MAHFEDSKICGEPSTVPGESAYTCGLPSGHGGGYHKCIDGKIWNKKPSGVLTCRFCEFQSNVDDIRKECGPCPRCRDQFAMAALTYPWLDGMTAGGEEKIADSVAVAAYQFADAMLEARKPR